MEQKKKVIPNSVKMLVLIGLFVAPAAVFYFLIYAGVHKVERLKFYGPKTYTLKMVRGAEVADTLYHEIMPFVLVGNSDSGQVPYNSKNLDGRIYLAHFLDASQLTEIPKEITFAASEILPRFPELVWVTFWENSDSIVPQYVLPSERTRKLTGTDHQWIELSGKDSVVQYLKNEGYFKHDESEPVTDPGSIVLVDKEGRIRSYFNPAMHGEITNQTKEILLLYKEYELAYKTHKFIQFN